MIRYDIGRLIKPVTLFLFLFLSCLLCHLINLSVSSLYILQLTTWILALLSYRLHRLFYLFYSTLVLSCMFHLDLEYMEYGIWKFVALGFCLL